jgi:hypothetical protein
MTEEKKDTSTQTPSEPGVSSEGHVEVETSTSEDSVAAAPAPQQEPKEPQEESTEQHRYLGKTYADVSQLEKAHANALQKLNEQGLEKNEYARRLETMESALKAAGLNLDETPVAPTQPQSASPADFEAMVSQRLQQEIAPLKQKFALREEQDALDELVRSKPHLAQAREHLRASWRLAGNKTLTQIAKDFEKLFDAGRNANKEDVAVKKEQYVETGRGKGEAQTPKADLSAKRSLTPEDIMSALPEDIFLNR